MEKNKKTLHVNLKQQASEGAFWGLSSNLIVSAISFVGTVILARILSPKDFGLLGMAVLITGVVRIFGNLGLGAALVQKKNIDNEYLSTAFWSSLLVSSGLVIVSIIIAPLAALFFNEPVIKWIVLCLSANFIISSFASIHQTLLYKDLRIKKIAYIEIVSRLVRVIIILFCAFSGMGFWSIVIGMIVDCLLKTVLFVFTVQWMPTFKFDKIKFKELFHFGKNIYGQGFLNYFNQNMDFIIIGRLLGAQLLGFYQFSYNVPYLVKSYVQDGIVPVAFSVFCKAQDDNMRLTRGFLNAVKYIAMLTFPVMFGLAFCADDFITVIYGVRWLSAAGPLKLLCFSAAFASVHCVVIALLNAKGRPDIGFKWNLFRLPITVITIIALSKYKIIGVAMAMFLVEFLTIVMVFFATKILNTCFVKYLNAIFPSIISSTVMIICLFFLQHYVFRSNNMYLRLVVNTFLGLAIYIICLKMFYKEDLKGLYDFIRLFIKK